MWAGLVSASVWFALFLFGQAFAFHIRPAQMRTRTIMRLFALAMAGHAGSMLLAEAALAGGLTAFGASLALSLSAGLILLLCLFVLYMPLYYSLNISLSVETLALLTVTTTGRMPMPDVEQRFCSANFLRDRLQTMEANGYLQKAGTDSWKLTGRGMSVARVMSAVKSALDLGPGG
jgi:hypothetical protein